MYIFFCNVKICLSFSFIPSVDKSLEDTDMVEDIGYVGKCESFL